MHIKNKISIDTLPAKLKEFNSWVCWKSFPRGNGKFGKKPINPVTGDAASVTDPGTWASVSEAITAIEKFNADGIGFVFTQDDSLVGIDLDDCRNSKTGEMEVWAEKIISNVESYTEISPSGKGVHIIANGQLPGKGVRKENLEIYDRERFFTVTGDTIPEMPIEVMGKAFAVTAIYESLLPAKSELPKDQIVSSDEKVIRKASHAANGESFHALWGGDTSGYPSQSEADIALCQMLAFWTDKDPARIDNLFRQSGLYREKWERSDYRNNTINKAVSVTVTTILESKFAPNFHLTDLGNSKRLINQFGNKIRYCSTWKSWLVWNGKFWELDFKSNVKMMARTVVKNIYHEAGNADGEGSSKIAKHAMKTESMSRLNSMVALAKDEPQIRVRAEDLDTDTWLLNCNNGLIDLRTGVLQPHEPTNLITNIVPVDFNPLADCPIWDDFLYTIMDGNEEMISFLQRAIGYSLTGETSEQCFFILYGSGANGKSTFLNPIIQMLNDYAKQSPAETFLNLKRRGVNNDIARLKGARFVTATEPDADQSFAEGVLKQLTGGDVVSARYLHQEYFDFIPVFKLFLATNHKPYVGGTDHGIWRRIRLVPFEVTIPKDQQDHQLTRKLIGELPGILAWAIQGCLEWQKHGLGEPQVVLDATEAYAKEMDTVVRFIDDRCEMGAGKKVSTQDLYLAYLNWCEFEGEEIQKKTAFGQRLKNQGYKPYRTSHERGWKGIALHSSQMPPGCPPVSENIPLMTSFIAENTSNLNNN